MHPAAYEFVKHALAGIDLAGVAVVEFGSYDVNNTAQGLSVRALCAEAAAYVGVDARPGPGVDVVSRAQDYRPKPRADLVICTEVLEHDPDPPGVIAAARRALKPGGVLILTAAGEGRMPHGCDGGPVGDEPYANITRADLEAWLDGWQDVTITENRAAGDIYATARTKG